MSLRLRLTLAYSALVVLLVIVYSVVLYTTTRQALESEMDRRLQVRANQVQLTIWPGTTSLRPEDLTSAKLNLAPLAALDAPNLYVQVLSRDGQIIARSQSLEDDSLPVETGSLGPALAGTRVLTDVTVDPDQAVRILNVPIAVDGNVVGVLQVGQSRLPLQETMARLRTQLQLLGAGALAVAGLVGWFVADRGLRPLSTMAQKAAYVTAQRDFSQRLRTKRREDEVERLAGTIDELLATIEDVLRTHREFLADTSHELRNPLLALRTNLDLVGRVADRESRAECVREAREQVDRMSRLVSDLLMLAQVEARQVIERKPIPLRPLLESVAREARQRSEGHEVRLDDVDSVVVLGDEDRLDEIFSNLVSNALKHTSPGGSIILGAEQDGGWIRVSIADTGEGIAAEDLPHVFERFYRGRQLKKSAADGTGLGLAIVKHLAEAHGGKVEVTSDPGQGSEFSVWLPNYDPRSGLSAAS